MNSTALRRLLAQVADGSLAVDEAMTSLRSLPFEQIDGAVIDHHRALRSGFPEVIYCEGKTPGQVAAIAEELDSPSVHLILIER